nr:hypothetical protein [uncultured Cohaesibacter sp.]
MTPRTIRSPKTKEEEKTGVKQTSNVRTQKPMLIKAKQDHHIAQHRHDWKDKLKWGDVILFPFPIADKRKQNAPEPRPCLIHDIRNIGGMRFVTLVYGSRLENKSSSSLQTDITNPIAMAAAGLNSPTVFDSNIRITVSLDHNGFKKCRSASPVIGRLIGPDRLRFKAIRARVQANIDMAAVRYFEKGRKDRSPKKPTLPSISLTKTATTELDEPPHLRSWLG